MNGPRLVDVREMLCAQALARVAQVMELLRAGEAVDVWYNAEDVKHDLLVWATEQGHRITAQQPTTLTITHA